MPRTLMLPPTASSGYQSLGIGVVEHRDPAHVMEAGGSHQSAPLVMACVRMGCVCS